MGMDVEAVEALAQKLESQAVNEVSTVVMGMSGTVQQLMTVWQGLDARQFDQQWSQHAKSLTLLHGALGDLLHSLTMSISDQRNASHG
jgi:uncharacterized protein YukE